MRYFKLLLALLVGFIPKPAREVTHVVLVSTLKMGDTVCMTPLFRAIKEVYPHARVTVVGDAIHKALLEHHPNVDEVLIFNQKDWWTCARHIKRLRASHGVMIDPNPYGLAMLLLAGLPVCTPAIVGYSPYATRTYRLLSRAASTMPLTIKAYVPREYLRLLEPLGIVTSDTTKTLGHGEAADTEASVLLENHPRPWVGYLPSAGHQAKCWEPARFRAVIEHTLTTHGGTAFVFGAAPDASIVDAVINPSDERILHLETNTLDLLKAVVSKLDLVVGVDTGPIYIAEAYKVPTVDIVGPVDENVQPPKGPCHAVVTPHGPRTPQLFILNSRQYDVAEVKRQLDDTRVEDVIAAIDSLMRTCIHSS